MVLKRGPKLFIGTSGWVYGDWRGFFYPEDLSERKWLEYFALHFKTVELNSSFYRLPKESTFLNWYKRTPKDFIFTVKVSRFISHVKYLKDCKEAWTLFYRRAKYLKEKLGPFLIQLPPNWKSDLERLKEFIKMIKDTSPQERFVFEFRNKSWFCPQIYQYFQKEKNITLCITDSVKWPKITQAYGDFVYIRFHGPDALYASKYSVDLLRKWAREIKKFLKENLDVFCYFNNDFSGFAIENARELLSVCHKESL